MKILTLSGIALLSVCLLSGCNNSNQSAKDGSQSSSDSVVNGEKKVYSKSGKLQYIVEYQNGQANGRVREYSADGKLYMDAIYKDGHRHGKCTHYFKNGTPFSISNYANGEKDGIETKFSQTGKTLAIIPYKNGKAQPGLKEFNMDGSLINNENNLLITSVNNKHDGKLYLCLTLSNTQKDAKFYASPESDPNSREFLKISGDAGYLELPSSAKTTLAGNLLFEAEYKTKMGNPMRIQKYYNLSAIRNRR